MTDVQARPAQLNTFATNGRTIHTTLDTARTTNKSAFVAFRNAAGGGCAAQGDGIVNDAMTDLLSELDEIPKWVKLVHDALIAADVTDANGNVSINANDLTLRMTELAGSEKNFNELASSRQLSVPLPEVGTVPPDSGFVNDPVCTATGHLLVDARDFVMPPRLDVLSFRRTYASQYLHNGAFGPGWWSWTECHGSIAADGSFEYVGPDGQELRLPAGADGRFIRRPELDIDVEALDDSTVRLRWGRRSRNPNQVWTFVGDRPAEVSGPFVGRTRFEWDRRGHVTSIRHDSGRTLTFRWKGTRVVGIESSDGRRARFDYNKAGHLVAVDNGRSPERYELDDEGRILWVTDADGVQTITMTYDDDGRVIAQVSETGFMTRFNYDEVRRTTLSDSDYNPLSVYTHDASGRVEMYATGGGYRFTRRFDALGRVVSQRDADGTSFALVDRVEGGLHVEEITWSTGDVERFEYDAAERLVRQSSARSSMAFTYDGASMFPRRIEVAGDQGLAVDLEWAHGAPTRIADSDGVVDVLSIRPDGTIESTTNGLGQTSRYDVDACGYVTRISRPDGSTVRYERDAAGRVVAMVDAAGHRGEIRYTAAGRMLSATDPNGAVTAIEYDDAGLPARVIAADGTETAIAFDDQQRIVGVKFANGDSVGLDLDEWGRQVAIEADDRRWETERDASGRILKRRDPSGAEIAQQYGELGGWMSITDAAGASWRFERDLVSRVRTLTTPSGREMTARYNAEGMLTSQSTSDGAEQEIRYTPAGRVESVTTGENRIDFRYDAAGRMIGANTGSGWWTFDLDSNGRIVRRVSPAGREQRYGYNVLDQLTSINVAGEIWEFDYDTAGRVVRSTDPTGRSATYDYDAVGRMIESRDGLGTPLHYAYDPRGRIAAMIDGHDGALRYEHNGLNQLTAITDQLGRRTNVHYDDDGRHVATTWLDPRRDAPSIPTLDQFGLDGADAVSFGDGVEPLGYSVSADGMSVTWTLASGDHVELKRDADGLAESLSSPHFTRRWTRDDCGRVITVVDDRAGVMSVSTLRRDPAGRVIEQTVDGAVTQFGYDDAGQLVSSTSESARSTWEYDELGRLIWERTPEVLRSFRYDDAHQLVELTEGGAVTTFEYDARGRRVRAAGARDVVYVWGATHLEAVVVDGVLQRFDTDASGVLRRAGDVEISWDTSFSTPRPVSVDGQRLLTVDGSTVGTVSSDGSVEWRPFKLADAWGGEPEAADHAEWHDYFGVAVEGLVWLGARPYDVVTRQFLAPDPLAPLPGMPGSTSPYTYAANDPVNLFDPTGRQPISIEAWNDVRDRRTGPQWQNIASVAIAVVAVAVTVVTLGSAGPLVMVLGGAAIGALAGGASGLARESIESNMNLGDGQFNGDAIVKDVIVGAAGGALGGGAGAGFNALASTTRIAGTPVASFLASRGGSAFTEGVSGFGEGVLGEVYDVTAPRNWGADGTWNNDAIVTNTVVSTVAGGALHGVGAPGTSGADVPTTSSADPADIDLPNSPTPNQPDPAPAASDTGSADTTTSAEAGTTNSDTGGGSHDTSADTSTDTSSDSSSDSSSDTSTDTSETSSDTSADTSGDTNSDTSSDTTSDSAADTNGATTSDTSSDTSTDTTADTSADTSDTSTDTTSDTSDTSTDTTDTSTDTSDASTDTTSDTTDTSTDTSDTTDTSTDTSDTSDTSTDTSDASSDTSTDTSTDTTSNTASDTTSNTSSSDTSTDVTSGTSPDTSSDTTSDTSADATSDTSADTADSSSDMQTGTTSNADTDTDASSSNGDTEAEVAAAAAVVAPTAAAASASSASSASAATSASSASGADTPSAGNSGGDPPTTNGDSNDIPAGDGDSDRLGDIRADERNVSTRTDDNGMTRITREHDANLFEFTVDADGYTRAVKFEINESYAGLDRTSAETSAQDRAAKGGGQPNTDDGGHMAGHRFSENQGDINQMAQNSNLNRGAYKKWENEMADWTARGYQVEGTVHANQPGGTRPDTIDMTYVVSDASGNVVHYGSRSFVNQQGQTFNRVYGRQMDRATTLYEGRPAGDVPPTTSDAAPASNGEAPSQPTPPPADSDTSPPNTMSGAEPAGVGATLRTPPSTDSGSAAGVNTPPTTEPVHVDVSGPDSINNHTIDNHTIDNQTIDNETIDNQTIGQQSPNDHLPAPRVPAGIAAGDLSGTSAGDLMTTMPETAPSTTLDVDVTGDLADSTSIPEPRSPMDAMQEGPEVDAPGTADADTPEVVEVDAPSAAEVETPQVTELETPDVVEAETPSDTLPETSDAADADTTEVTDSTDSDQTVDPTDSADPDAGNPPQTYTVDGQQYTPSFSPDQLNNAPTANEAVDSVLSDNDLFARHGFDPPWSRQDLIDAINTKTADLTPAQRDMLNAIRDRMPFPHQGETIQKVITPDQLRDYLDNVIASPAAPNTVGGSQTRAVDTAHLRSPDELFDGLRLDYDRTPFRPGQNSVHVIRYVPSNDPEFAVPRNSTMGGSARFDTWTDPFTGNGFTKATDDVIPEFQGVNTMRSGAEMWEIMNDGTQQLTAVLRGDVWVRVD